MNKEVRNDLVKSIIIYTIVLFIIVCCSLLLSEIINHPEKISFGGW